MTNRRLSKREESPLLYYKTREEIEAYHKKPVKLKLQWLEAQMEFFYKAMPLKAKRIREELEKFGFRMQISGISLSREILRERKWSKR